MTIVPPQRVTVGLAVGLFVVGLFVVGLLVVGLFVVGLLVVGLLVVGLLVVGLADWAEAPCRLKIAESSSSLSIVRGGRALETTPANLSA